MIITDELVEKVARSLAERHWRIMNVAVPSDNLWRAYTPEARAALSIAAREITEACAKVCEEIALIQSMTNAAQAAEACASTIRALARQTA